MGRKKRFKQVEFGGQLFIHDRKTDGILCEECDGLESHKCFADEYGNVEDCGDLLHCSDCGKPVCMWVKVEAYSNFGGDKEFSDALCPRCVVGYPYGSIKEGAVFVNKEDYTKWKEQ